MWNLISTLLRSRLFYWKFKDLTLSNEIKRKKDGKVLSENAKRFE